MTEDNKAFKWQTLRKETHPLLPFDGGVSFGVWAEKREGALETEGLKDGWER